MDTKRDKHQPKFTPQMTLGQFDRLFPNEEACRDYLFSHRWPKGATCPRCHKAEKVYKLESQPWKWECWSAECAKGHAYRFSLIAGTIFENTKYPLLTWFKVLYLMLTSKKGISALQIHRMIGSGSYKTAFYMCHRLRASLQDPEFRQLMGVVEVDETFIGGKAANMHLRKRKALGLTGTMNKIPVVGAIARKGNVVCRMIASTDTPTLDSFVRRTINRKVELIATDEHSGYRLLSEGPDGLPHFVVRHSSGEYVRGVVTFRFNNRHNPDIFGTAVSGS